ncbi:endonuclease/exonuclease/phosphatase family protein [Streptomyces sp. NPDC048442]|uniref:endonuclease/exonuclease/phosphatase family protein n=1 Tax=Streptomyces sp. NPDC048442 TaxID=3154823 RepID=UPI003425244E
MTSTYENDQRETPARGAWPDGRHWGEDEKGRNTWRRGRLVGLAAVLLGLLPVFHGYVPDARGVGSLAETFLPWLGLLILPLLMLARRRRSALALVALVVPVGAYGGLVGGAVVGGGGGASYDFSVVQHNIADDNPDPAGAVRALAAAGPKLIALEEVTAGAAVKISGVLGAEYPHHAVVGTVGLWSVYPLRDVTEVDLKPEGIKEPWKRGMRATALTPKGHVAVHVAHLPSVRATWPQGLKTGWRNEAAVRLGAALKAERTDRVILLGDLNATADDRGLDPVVSEVNDTGGRFGFSWPQRFPVARLDHVMVRGGEVVRFEKLAATGSDHVPVLARVRF